jgi:NodT family efflux transporter outer membrane factor (OMF) lipoprotein
MKQNVRGPDQPGLMMLSLTVALGACTVGPDYRRPDAVTSAQFKEVHGWKEAQPRDHELPGTWWEVFNDPQLNALEAQVDLANQSLAQAEAQYRQAQALVRGDRANLFPNLAGSASAQRFQARGGQNLVVSGVRNLYALSVNASWEPDFWGSVRRQLESDTAAAQSSAATWQALRLSTEATLAQNYFQLHTLDAQKRNLYAAITAYEKALTVTRNRYTVGVAALSDVVQAQTQLESTRAQAIDLDVQRTQLEHAIALLIGKVPAELTVPAGSLPAAVPVIPVGVPSELLERRPDIAAAERQVAAANAQIGVAKAAYYPTFTLAAQTGYQSNSLSQLISTASRFWALGPAALAPTLFDGGARSATLQQAITGHEASVAAYRQAVLTAMQETEDNLAALRILADEATAQDQVVQLADKSVTLTTNQYKAGTVSYLNVVTAQNIALTNEKTAIALRGQRLNATVLLIKALGGGWHDGSLPSAHEAAGNTTWKDYLPVPTR